ncbi:MAG: GspH/FimT family pseudopilin [Planctomycetota bacterium]
MISTTGRSAKLARGRAGFTLLELVLVMVIICTVLGMASVSLRTFFGSRQTHDAGAQMVALTQFARAQAVAEGRIYRLNLDTQDGKYWLTAQTGGAFTAPGTEFGRMFLLPERTVARWGGRPATGERDWIAFYPDGRTEPAAISLTGQQGETVEVVCASPAEGFRVVVGAGGGAP